LPILPRQTSREITEHLPVWRDGALVAVGKDQEIMGHVWSAFILLLGVALGIGIGVAVRYYWLEKRTKKLQEQAKAIVNEARREAETIKKEAILQAKDTLFQMKAEFEKESKETRRELQNLEKRILQKRGEPGSKIRKPR